MYVRTRYYKQVRQLEHLRVYYEQCPVDGRKNTHKTLTRWISVFSSTTPSMST